jgi:hypothetical protein
MNAVVAELADALGSGPSARKSMGVQIPSTAPVLKMSAHKLAHKKIMTGVFVPAFLMF